VPDYVLPSLPSQTPSPVTPAQSAKLTDAINRIGAGKTGAFEVTGTLTGAEAFVGYRINRTWSVGAWAAKEWSGRADAGVRVSASW
jgi:hypothetical protein